MSLQARARALYRALHRELTLQVMLHISSNYYNFVGADLLGLVATCAAPYFVNTP